MRFILIFLFLSVNTGALAASWSDAYSRRNFQLGLTLSEFRKTIHPDQKEWPRAYPLCSSDPLAKNKDYTELFVRNPWSDFGVIKCQFFWQSSSDYSVSSAGLLLGDIPSHTEFYFYRPSNENEPVLFYITSGGPSGKFEELAGLFERSLGAPSIIQTETVKNGLGANFENTIIKYVSVSSEIEISRYGETLRVLSVEHRLTPVWSQLMEILELRQKQMSDKL